MASARQVTGSDEPDVAASAAISAPPMRITAGWFEACNARPDPVSGLTGPPRTTTGGGLAGEVWPHAIPGADATAAAATAGNAHDILRARVGAFPMMPPRATVFPLRVDQGNSCQARQGSTPSARRRVDNR